jgi:PTH1 family peptidyl-tRNA hydrolase
MRSETECSIFLTVWVVDYGRGQSPRMDEAVLHRTILAKSCTKNNDSILHQNWTCPGKKIYLPGQVPYPSFFVKTVPALTHVHLRVKLTSYQPFKRGGWNWNNFLLYLSMAAMENMKETFLIVGLGNPGREYRETRHNVGFMLLDRLAARLGVRFTRLQSRALIASAFYASKKDGEEESRIILAKPQTYMNLSGRSVQGLIHYYKVPLTNLLVAHDDLDLPPGTIRIRPDGGSAGQKGMKSILEHLGTDMFSRIRLGIGHPPGQMQAPDYVLQEFSNSELVLISETLDLAAEAVLTFVSEGLDSAMNKYNGIVV